MLRITVTETASEQKWTLQGRLTEPWVAELISSWESTRGERENRRCVVDAREVTLIDESGKRMLQSMVDSGAECIACGLYMGHLVESIKQRYKKLFGD
jgi:hypothetical protein